MDYIDPKCPDCEKMDRELSYTETKSPGVGLLLLLTTAILFWGGMWYIFHDLLQTV